MIICYAVIIYVIMCVFIYMKYVKTKEKEQLPNYSRNTKVLYYYQFVLSVGQSVMLSETFANYREKHKRHRLLIEILDIFLFVATPLKGRYIVFSQ